MEISMLIVGGSTGFKDFSYLKRFMMQAMAIGMPVMFSLHGLRVCEHEEAVYTFALRNDNGQESWPMFLRNRTDAMLRAVEFLTLYNCKIDPELDNDEQFVQFTFNS